MTAQAILAQAILRKLKKPTEIFALLFVLRQEFAERIIDVFAHIPTQNCLANFLRKASSKADNLITEVQTGTWCRTIMHMFSSRTS